MMKLTRRPFGCLIGPAAVATTRRQSKKIYYRLASDEAELVVELVD
jgi:hypothetical protein